MQGNTTISVDKRAEPDAFEAPAVVYELASALDSPKSLRIREQIPEGFDATDLGFHQEHYADQWWVGDEEIVFECTLEPEETLQTIVGVRTDEHVDLDPFLSRPTVEIAAAEDDECWGAVADERVGYAVDGEPMPAPMAATDGGQSSLAGEASDERSDAGDESGSDDTADTDSIESAIPAVEEADDAERPAETGWPAAGDDAELVDRFVEELSGDSLSAAQRERLRSAIGVDSITSMDARIEHCQQRLSDLDAYVEALETFLDEEGSGQQLIEDFRDDVSAVESDLAALSADVEATADDQAALRDRVETIEDEVASLRAVRQDVASLESRLDETTTEIRSEIEALRSTVDRLAEWQRGVTSAFDDLQSAESARDD